MTSQEIRNELLNETDPLKSIAPILRELTAQIAELNEKLSGNVRIEIKSALPKPSPVQYCRCWGPDFPCSMSTHPGHKGIHQHKNDRCSLHPSVEVS